MTTTLLYGQPGTGKSTLATGIALDYLRQGRRVVANFAIDAAPACRTRKHSLRDAFVTVLPSRPSFADIEALGLGWRNPELEAGREERAGLLIVDEAGPWLDSRRWQDSDRPKLIDWMLHSRKRGWDLVLIAQHPALIDKQVREAVMEGYCRIRRTDRMRFFNLFKLPRLHIGVVRYGLDANAPKLEHYVYRGKLEHKCFSSYALFDAVKDGGAYCTLPPRLTRWREPPRPGLLSRLQVVTTARSKPAPKPKLPHVEAAMRLPAAQRVRVLRDVECGALGPA